MKEILRWIAVLPAAFLGSQALYLLTRFDILFAWSHSVVAYAIYGPAFVLFGSYTAPRARTVVAIVLTGFNFLCNVLWFFTSEKLNRRILLGLIMSNVGAVIAVLFIAIANRKTKALSEPAA